MLRRLIPGKYQKSIKVLKPKYKLGGKKLIFFAVNEKTSKLIYV